MKRLSLSLLSCIFLLLLSACAPSAAVETQSELYPEGADGRLLCTVIYIPGQELSLTIENQASQDLALGPDEGSLYLQAADGQWEKVRPEEAAFIEAICWPVRPGETRGGYTSAGLEAPTLEPGNYRLDFPAGWETAAPDSQPWPKFTLSVPFTVSIP